MYHICLINFKSKIHLKVISECIIFIFLKNSSSIRLVSLISSNYYLYYIYIIFLLLFIIVLYLYFYLLYLYF